MAREPDYPFDTLGRFAAQNERSASLPGTKRSADVVLALSAIGFFLFIGGAVLLEPWWSALSRASVHDAPLFLSEPSADTGRAINRSVFDGVPIRAESALVFEPVDNDVLFERSANTQRPIASLTKLMTALVALEVLGTNTELAITRSSLAEEGDIGLYANEAWRVEDLAEMMLMSSSNDIAHALSVAGGRVLVADEELTEAEYRLMFVQRMNTRARDLGLFQTRFSNASGLDIDATSSGALSSARDIATLTAHMLAYHPKLLEVTRYPAREYKSLASRVLTVKNTNERIGEIPYISASKTGFTDLAGGNLVVVFDAGFATPVIVVVLGSTFRERFSDVETLVQTSLRARLAIPQKEESPVL